MARLLKITAVAIFGAILLMIGLIYDVMYAGIPPQDPSPELQEKWRGEKLIADLLLAGGGFLFLLGVALAPILWWATRKRKPKQRRRSLDDPDL